MKKPFKKEGRQSGEKGNWPTEGVIYRRYKRARDINDIRYFLKKIFIVGVFLIGFFGLLFGVHPVRDKDMEPVLSAGDLVIFNRWERDFYKGDLVVYSQDNKSCVGRVIARGGDEVEITEDRRVKVNGYFEYEEKIFYDTPAYDERVTYPLSVAEESYFILADYREGAKDSRYYGTIPREDIKGKAVAIMRWMNL